MLPSGRIVLARHKTPNGEIQLQQRLLQDGSPAFEIISNGVFLMASYHQTSERALARFALKTIPVNPDRNHRVLVGGLGMGFTVRETLNCQVVTVDVVERDPHVVEWNRIYFGPLNGDVLADLRVRLIQDDLFVLLGTTAPATYQAILLDVDNGPSWLVGEKNKRLYTIEALEGWSKMLRPGGSLSVWSAQREAEFLARLRSVFAHAKEVSIIAPHQKGQSVEYFLYGAIKSSV